VASRCAIPAALPPLNLDQVAAVLASLRPGWTRQGLTAGPLTWRDARASWPKPLLTDRSLVAEPESVGLALTAADGRTGRMIIWRGGWADIDLLDNHTVTTRNPAIHDLAGCIAQASAVTSQLTTPPSPQAKHPPELSPVTVLWVTGWPDSPVEGMASYQDRDGPVRLPGRATCAPQRRVPRRGGNARVRSLLLHVSRRPGSDSDTTRSPVSFPTVPCPPRRRGQEPGRRIAA
jgi:hypothetical protein